MTDRPIIFSGPMVRALLEGRKTQTRRLLSLRGYRDLSDYGPSDTVGYDWHFRRKDLCWCDITNDRLTELLPYAIGDRMWVKETWSHTGTGVWQTGDVAYARDGQVIYRATEDRPGAGWFPSIFMFRRLSRLTLTVTDVRLQRLQDISEDDAIAEGIQQYGRFFGLPDTDWDDAEETAPKGFQNLWDSLNAKRAPWDSNPWVVAISFDVVKGNIDQRDHQS